MIRCQYYDEDKRCVLDAVSYWVVEDDTEDENGDPMEYSVVLTCRRHERRLKERGASGEYPVLVGGELP